MELNKDSYIPAIECVEMLGRQGYCSAVALIPLDKNGKRQGIGSGVLVRVDDMYAILTANHVVQAIQKQQALGIGFGARRDVTQVLRLPVEVLVAKTIGSGEDTGLGPDLALIMLPACHINLIKAIASFYTLKDLPELHLDNPNQNTLLCTGVLGTEIKAQNGHEIIPLGHLGMVAHPEIVHRRDFDYITCMIDETTLGVRLGLESETTSFEGVSGAPLWQRQQDDSLRLIGIAYYQDLENPKDKKVTFHGPMSIYMQAKAVLKKYPS